MQNSVTLNDNYVASMARGRVFKDNEARINCLDFHRTEDLLVTSSDDDTIHVYNVATGTLQDTLLSKKYGVQNINFTHHPSGVVYASNKGTDHALRYLMMYDNRYMRFFVGHTARVTSLTMSPKNDLFMSASQDRSVRLWDLRTNVCQGIMHVPGQPTASFDQQGLVFAVATESGVLKLYDVRSYEKGPFDTFVVQEEVNSPVAFSHVRFSADGKLMLAAMEGRVYVLDAFRGSALHRITTGPPPDSGTPPTEATFSCDSRYVLCGCEDRTIAVFNAASGERVATWQPHAGVPTCVRWAPRRLLVASACQALVLWIPRLHELQGGRPT